jgi:hypothetical protein
MGRVINGSEGYTLRVDDVSIYQGAVISDFNPHHHVFLAPEDSKQGWEIGSDFTIHVPKKDTPTAEQIKNTTRAFGWVWKTW